MKKSTSSPPPADDSVKLPTHPAAGSRKKAVAMCFLVAFLLFALTLGSEVLAVKVLPDSDAVQFKECTYSWGESVSTMASGIIRWGGTSEKEPLLRPFGQNYLRIKAILPPIEDDSTLELEYDNFVLKVQLNGEKVYDDGYGEAEYSAETRAKIAIPASTAEQRLEIFAYVPFAYNLKMSMYPAIRAITPLGTAINYAGIVVSLLAIITGIIMTLIPLVVSKSPKHIGKLIILGMSVSVCGLSLLTDQLIHHTTFITRPVWLNFELFLSMFVTLCILSVTIVCYNRWKRSIAACLILGVVCSLMMLFTRERLPMLALFIVFALADIVLTVMLTVGFVEIIDKKLPYVQLCMTAFLFFSMINVYNAVSFIIGMNGYSTYFNVLSIFFFCSVTFVVFYQQALFLAVRKPERDKQIESDSRWIADITSAVSGIFVQKTPADFFLASAENLLSLIQNNVYNTAWEEYPYNPSYSLPEPEKDVVACAAMYVEGEGYVEIFNSGDAECDYDDAAEHFGEPSGLLFSDDKLNVLFLSNGNDTADAVLHFSNIPGGQSLQFKNMVSAMYSSMSMAYENLLLKDDMVMTQENIFISLAETVELKNESTTRHLNAVSQITRILCDALGMPPYVSHLVSSASMVHDLGKIAIPESLIDKRGKLTSDEMRVMKQHIVFGYNILSQSHGEFMNAAAIIAQQHHEKFDGTGYIGLSGDDIHLYARIVAVADVFDALSVKRSYKEAWPVERIVKYINEQSGKHFDPQVVDALNRSLDSIAQIEGSFSVTAD